VVMPTRMKFGQIRPECFDLKVAKVGRMIFMCFCAEGALGSERDIEVVGVKKYLLINQLVRRH